MLTGQPDRRFDLRLPSTLSDVTSIACKLQAIALLSLIWRGAAILAALVPAEPALPPLPRFGKRSDEARCSAPVTGASDRGRYSKVRNPL